MQLFVLFQLVPDDGEGRFNYDTCKDGLHAMRCNVFPFPRFDEFDLIHKVIGFPDAMWEMSYQWSKDVGYLLSHPIGS